MQSEVNQEENLNRIITVPNLLSFFRLCLIPVIIWSYCVKKNLLLAGEILLLSGLTDLADGYIARRFHRISNLGKILDPVADKPTQTAMLICLFTRFPHMLLLIVIMAGKELYMVVSGCLVIRKTGKVHGADWHGKIVTFLLYGTAAGAYYMVPHYTDGIRSVDWFVRYNDGHIGRSVYYPEYQDS